MPTRLGHERRELFEVTVKATHADIIRMPLTEHVGAILLLGRPGRGRMIVPLGAWLYANIVAAYSNVQNNAYMWIGRTDGVGALLNDAPNERLTTILTTPGVAGYYFPPKMTVDAAAVDWGSALQPAFSGEYTSDLPVYWNLDNTGITDPEPLNDGHADNYLQLTLLYTVVTWPGGRSGGWNAPSGSEVPPIGEER